MKKFTFIALSAMLAVGASAATRVHTVSGNVKGLSVCKGAKAEYVIVQGNASVEVSGPDQYIPFVQVVNKGGTLTVSLNDPDNSSRGVMMPRDLRIVIKAPAVSKLSAETAGELKLRESLPVGKEDATLTASTSGEIELYRDLSSTGKVKIAASTSGDVKVGLLRAASLTVSGSTSGDVDIDEANVTTLAVDAQTSADVEIHRLNLSTGKVAVSSSGSVELKGVSAKSLDLAASSGGDIEVKGHCDATKAAASSGGKIDVRDLRGSITPATSSGGHVRLPR